MTDLLVKAVPDASHGNDCGCGCADDFKPADRPSIAALHRQWLDRGLPSHTWATWLRQYNEMYGDLPRPVEHTHVGTACHPGCRRWGT